MAYWRLRGSCDTIHGYASRKLELGDEGNAYFVEGEKFDVFGK